MKEISNVAAIKEKRHWLGDQTTCDLCHKPLNWIANKPWFVDGRTGIGPWALMCPKCFEHHGCGLGVGFGQKYSCLTKEKLEG